MKFIRLQSIWLLILSFSWCKVAAQDIVSVGFYNVENLYDTIPSLFYDDSDYTPKGSRKWDTKRYFSKVNNIARVIDEMSLDILGLAEVENEDVVRDIVSALQTDYNYIHVTSNDRRGMDLAMLYKGDKFFPEDVRSVRSGTTRDFLYVSGEMYGLQIDIVVAHLPSQLNSKSYRKKALQNLRDLGVELVVDGRRLVMMGDFNTHISDRMFRAVFYGKNDSTGYFDIPFNDLARQGVGTYGYNSRWRFIDNIILGNISDNTPGLRYESCGVFIRPYLLDFDTPKRTGLPKRTFSSGRYLDGYSDHLPVYMYLSVE